MWMWPYTECVNAHRWTLIVRPNRPACLHESTCMRGNCLAYDVRFFARIVCTVALRSLILLRIGICQVLLVLH